MEVSYKYTHAEALTLFHASGFRLIQQWSDSQSLHTVYLLEQPAVLFPSNSPIMKEVGVEVPSNPYGLPSMEEWEQMWTTWDMLTVSLSSAEAEQCQTKAETDSRPWTARDLSSLPSAH